MSEETKVSNQETENNIKKTTIPVNYGVDNQKLDKAIAYLTESQTEINRQMMLKELKVAKVLVPIKLDGSYQFTKDGKIEFSEDSKLEYILIKNANNEHYCAIFTNEEEFKKFNIDHTGQIVQKFTSVAETITATETEIKGIVVNPFGSGIILDKELVAMLLKPDNFAKITTNRVFPKKPAAVAPKRLFEIPKGTTVAVGSPKQWPTSMTDALTKEFQNNKKIDRAWLRIIQWPNQKNANGQPLLTYLVLTETTEKPEEIFPKLSNIAEPLSEGLHTDFMVFNKNNSFAVTATKDAEPFYIRKKFLGIF